MADVTKTLNGIDLHQPDRGWSLQHATTSYAGLSNERTTVSVPGRHGVLSPRRRMVADERPVGLTWLLRATSQGGLEATWHDLMGLLQTPSLTYGHVAGGVTTVADAELVSVSDVSGDDFLVGTHLRFSAVLALPGVFLRDPSWSTLAVPAGASTHTVLAGSAPITDAVVRWGPGPIAGPPYSLTDTTTGTGVSLDFVAADGYYLYLDTALLAAWVTSLTGEWAPGVHPRRSQHVDYPGPGPLQLWPVLRQSGDDLIREVKLQASHPCTIRYRKAYL